MKLFVRWMVVSCVVLALGLWGGCADPPVEESPPQEQPADQGRDGAVEPGPPETRSEPRTEPTPEPRTEPVPEVGSDQPAACKPGVVVSPDKGFFVDISAQSGIQVGNFIRDFTKKIPINDHSRLGFADINGDGYDDIVAHSLYPNAQAGVPFTHVILLNNGDGTFRDVSKESGLKDVQAAFFVFGDIDNDGDQDCYAGLDIQLGNTRSQIYLNDGKGHFTLKPNSGVAVANLLAASAVFGDFNNDGKLDLYVGAGGTTAGINDALFMGNGDGTFANKSSQLKGNRRLASNGVTTCDFDNDGDLDIIVSGYGVSNQLGANMLWQNDGKGNFTDVARAKGFEALPGGNYYLRSTGNGTTPEPGKQPGQYVGSNGFGVDSKDVNNDGYYDIFLATISHPNEGIYSRKWSDPSQLLINGGPDKQYAFQNEFLKRGLSFNEGDIDAALIDFDNDGRLDVSLTRDNKYEKAYGTFEQKAWFGLFRQLASGGFRSVGGDSGINVLSPKDSASLQKCDTNTPCPSGESCLLKRCRQACTKDDECKSKDDHCASYWDAASSGVIKFCRASLKMKGGQNHAWSDIDKDGDLDLLVGGRDKGGGRPNFLYRNDIGAKNRWLAIRLVGDGVKINRDAIGGRVSLTYKGGLTLSREVQSARGTYSSLDTRVLHFGLGSFGCDYQIEIRWPNGENTKISRRNIRENRYTTITYPDKVE